MVYTSKYDWKGLGYSSYKEFQKDYKRDWYAKNNEHARAKRKERYYKNKVEDNKKKAREELEKRKTNPEYRIKYEARQLARTIPMKISCQICNSKVNLQRHHADYNKPLEFITLCYDCHTKIHNTRKVFNFKKEEKCIDNGRDTLKCPNGHDLFYNGKLDSYVCVLCNYIKRG